MSFHGHHRLALHGLQHLGHAVVLLEPVKADMPTYVPGAGIEPAHLSVGGFESPG